MDTYAHPSHDWERVAHLLEPDRSPARSAIALNLSWFRELLARRNGLLLMVSRKEHPFDTVGVIAISCDGTAVIVHFYFVVPSYENSEALLSLFDTMITFAEGRGATTVRLPVIVEFARPGHFDFFGGMSTMHLDGPWQSGHTVRTYSIPLDRLKKAIRG